jgi:hypothetical protein
VFKPLASLLNPGNSPEEAFQKIFKKSLYKPGPMRECIMVKACGSVLEKNEKK